MRIVFHIVVSTISGCGRITLMVGLNTQHLALLIVGIRCWHLDGIEQVAYLLHTPIGVGERCSIYKHCLHTLSNVAVATGAE